VLDVALAEYGEVGTISGPPSPLLHAETIDAIVTVSAARVLVRVRWPVREARSGKNMRRVLHAPRV
jgi:hypothetical protein